MKCWVDSRFLQLTQVAPRSPEQQILATKQAFRDLKTSG